MKTALLTLTVASFALASGGPAAAKPIKANYTCAGGQILHVVFGDGQAVVTTKTGRPITLTQARTADGFEYRDATHSLRGRGDNATWTKTGIKPLECTAKNR